MLNYGLDLNGLTVEMKYAEPFQKVMIAVFFLIANTSVYLVIAKASQMYKKKHEDDVKEELTYTI